jgi:hypothetical protein
MLMITSSTRGNLDLRAASMQVNANRMADQQKDPRTFFKSLQATFPVLRYIDDRQGVSLISIDEMLSRKDGEDIFLYLKKERA